MLAPMPSVKTSTTVSENAGRRRMSRAPYFTSCQTVESTVPVSLVPIAASDCIQQVERRGDCGLARRNEDTSRHSSDRTAPFVLQTSGFLERCRGTRLGLLTAQPILSRGPAARSFVRTCRAVAGETAYDSAKRAVLWMEHCATVGSRRWCSCFSAPRRLARRRSSSSAGRSSAVTPRLAWRVS